jgi:tetratricopeptide (TPR) repeat protein
MVLLGRGELQSARKVFDEIAAGLPALPRPGPKFFAPMMLGFAVEGAATVSPRLHFEETVLLGRRVGADQAGAYVQCNLAYLARLAEDLDEARSLVEDAASVFRGIGDREGEALAVNHLGCLHRVQGDFAASRGCFEQSLQIRLALGDRRATGLTLCSLGVLTAAEGNVDRGIGLLQEALSGFRDTEDVPALVAVRFTMASVYATAGAADQACRLLPEALRESRRIPGNHRGTAWGFAVLADVYRRLGRSNEAIQALRDAQEQFGHLGAVDGAEHVRLAVQAQTAH